MSPPERQERQKNESQTRAEQIYQSLRDDILSNRLLPGTALLEVAIADSWSVSRAPVREAIRLLVADGLVTMVPRRGAEVSSLSVKDFLEAYQVREALEVQALRLAIPQLTEADFAELEQLQELMTRYAVEGDVNGFFNANRQFHFLFVNRCGNTRLKEIYEPLSNQMGRYRMPSLYLRGGMERSIGEHQTLIEALRTGDGEESCRLLREHISMPQRIMESQGHLEVVLPSSGQV